MNKLDTAIQGVPKFRSFLAVIEYFLSDSTRRWSKIREAEA